MSEAALLPDDLKKLLLRIYAAASPNYRRLRRLEDKVDSLQGKSRQIDELHKVLARTLDLTRVNARNLDALKTSHAQQHELKKIFREIQMLLNFTRKSLIEALRKGDINNRAVVSEIMAHGASFPTIMARSLPFYGQVAEDLMIESICAALLPDRLRKHELTYLDVGANHPINTSNTYRFYQQGHRGVLIEPIPSLAEELRRVRPEDTVLEIGVKVDERTDAELYRSDHHEISSFRREFIEDFIRRNNSDWSIVQTLKIPLVSINDIISEHFDGRAPDLLDIDVESFDYEVLQSIDYERFHPSIICIEPSDDFVKPKGHENNSARIEAFLRSHSYRLVARTRINQLFVDEALLEASVKA